MASTRILISGGAGFIGSHLARRLVQDQHSVVVLDNLHPQVHTDQPKINLPDCETIWADVRDADALTRAMKGVEVLYHFAAETGVGQSQYEIGRYVSVNTLGTALLLEAAAAAGVHHVVIASSRAIYGEGQFKCESCNHIFDGETRRATDLDSARWDVYCPRCGAAGAPLPMSEDTPAKPASIYGITKLQQEELAFAVAGIHGFNVTILRLFNVYGPGQSLHNPYVGVLGTFFRRATANATIDVYEDGGMLRDFVFVTDVVDVMQRVINNELTSGRVFNVGLGKAVTIHDAAAEMFRTLGKTPRIQVSGRYRLGDIRHAVASVSRLNEALGNVPRTTFAEGLRQFVEWAAANEADAADDQAQAQLAARRLLRQSAV